MKTRRLPETDLARIAPLDRDAKWKALQKQKTGFSPWSYDPVRGCSPDILNLQFELLGPSPDTSLAKIERTIRKKAKHPDALAANLETARLFYHLVRERGITASAVDFRRFGTRPGDSVAYWLNAILVYQDQLLIPFPDFRRSVGMNAEARRFAASIAREHISAPYQEFSAAKLAVFQFPQSGDVRTALMRVVDDSALYSADELAGMIAETYEMWAEVLVDRAEEARRSGTTGGLI